MNKLVKISSLALVALLASCGKNAATPLKKIDGETAMAVVNAICNDRVGEFYKLMAKEKGVQNNQLFINNDGYLSALFPYSKRRISADVTISNTTTDTLYDIPIVTTIKKHVFFDMDKLYYHCHTSITRHKSDYETITYPDSDYYFFFIEDEKQDEEVVETEYDKTGFGYILNNTSNLIKAKLLQSPFTKGEFTGILAEAGPFVNNKPIVEQDMRGFATIAFDLEAALSNDLISVVPQLAILDNYDASFESSVESATKPLLMDEWLNDNFSSTLNELENFRTSMKEVLNDETYFDFALRSNDAKSLGVDTDFSYCEDGEAPDGGKLNGITTYTSSFTIRDLYLTESHFDITSDTTLESQTDGTKSSNYFSTKFDQYINYNPSDNIEIPSDYLEYTYPNT